MIGRSSSTRPSWTASITTVAVYSFEMDWTLNRVSVVTRWPPFFVVEPKAASHRGPDRSQIPMASLGYRMFFQKPRGPVGPAA